MCTTLLSRMRSSFVFSQISLTRDSASKRLRRRVAIAPSRSSILERELQLCRVEKRERVVGMQSSSWTTCRLVDE